MAPQSPFCFTTLPPLTLYVHLPWCARKCPYCDFNSHAVREAIPETRYIDALLADLDYELPRVRGRRVEAIFIGGGTPSLFSAQSIDRLLTGISARFTMRPDAEITLEANPGSVEEHKFGDFRAAGVTRLSIGAQSFNDELLKKLGRIHGGREAVRAAEIAHHAGFDNFNIDLMFGLPGQDTAACLDDLRIAIELAPTHISFYQLTIEPNTFFHHQPPALPDDETIWHMHTQGMSFMADRGYTQYDVSAYARTGRRCRHNLNYWEFGDYLGIGAGSHGKLSSLSNSIHRRHKHRQPRQYMECALQHQPVAGENKLSAADAIFEFMLNALRLSEGFDASLFAERTGLAPNLLASRVAGLVARGLLRQRDGRIGPTYLGRRFLNDLTEAFLADDERTD
ncbi:MAG: oxygen-independent coproporphyrinogen III oxidase-like protein [Gammaproteobacteria bacterium]|nr:oxygen-independent coproporphyrinogen III oxidase-like protein [Gammaproteobacteria bacterium]